MHKGRGGGGGGRDVSLSGSLLKGRATPYRRLGAGWICMTCPAVCKNDEFL